jgi:hypothetical protein
MTAKIKADAYDKLLAEAAGKYELPDYQSESHRDFVVLMHKKGYEIRHYSGRGYYVGPAVVVEGDKVTQARKDAGMELLIDNMALDFVLYPKKG